MTATLTATTGSGTTGTARTAGGRWAALVLLVSAQFVVMLDTSIVNVALPSIQADLGLRPTAFTWVVNAYVLSFGGLLLLAGRAADLFGRRRMFVGGSVLFTVGTLVAASARAQPARRWTDRPGLGAAALSPAAMSLLLLTFRGQARARAMSIWGAASTLGGATGVMPADCSPARSAGPRSSSSPSPSPWPPSSWPDASSKAASSAPPDAGSTGRGAATITGAVVALVHGALGIADHGWTSPTVVAALHRVRRRSRPCSSAIERRTSRPAGAPRAVPLPDPDHRRRPRRTRRRRPSIHVRARRPLPPAGPQPWRPQQAGLAMVPTSLTGFAVSLALLPRILRVLGPRRSLVAGLVVLAAGHLWLAYAPTGSGYVARRPARPAARRHRRRPQLHAHHHGHRRRRPRHRTPASPPAWPGRPPRSAPPSARRRSPPSASPSAVPSATPSARPASLPRSPPQPPSPLPPRPSAPPSRARR